MPRNLTIGTHHVCLGFRDRQCVGFPEVATLLDELPFQALNDKIKSVPNPGYVLLADVACTTFLFTSSLLILAFYPRNMWRLCFLPILSILLAPIVMFVSVCFMVPSALSEVGVDVEKGRAGIYGIAAIVSSVAILVLTVADLVAVLVYHCIYS